MTLYVHIPFCLSKCPYCAFVSSPRQDDLVAAYLAALEREASSHRGTAVTSIYIGGGTPTVLEDGELKDLLDMLKETFRIAPDAEFTVEANPATFDKKKARLLKDAGVNRMSLGVQSFNDEVLRWLGRPHTASQARAGFSLLRDAGFDNINADMIYGLPGFSAEDVLADVEGLISLESEHVSVYLLSIDEGSAFCGRGIVLPAADEQGRLFRAVRDRLAGHGYEHYEVSNFARPGYACRHNISYWRGGSYIGLGAAAHSHIDGCRSWNIAGIPAYILALQDHPTARSGEECLDAAGRFMETFLIGLRLTEGVDVPALEGRFGAVLPDEKERLVDDMVAEGLLVRRGTRLSASPSGVLVLDEICRRLI